MTLPTESQPTLHDLLQDVKQLVVESNTLLNEIKAQLSQEIKLTFKPTTVKNEDDYQLRS
ncbi:hypothetical protein MTX78_24925 (plasmid) [Hymenobacter tibetensis]|uniref:Uncharacterized protein n=1 Tax=Hymenobacter tibetensis TaxID=497967 RepID=A0ABY4D5W7_9BACT|nr:hypothetical protein [Hymenobacter tibetensis]UOG77656.1 hypothetical protein MTX78_24925 [Hymenobacter tibetensis]